MLLEPCRCPGVRLIPRVVDAGAVATTQLAGDRRAGRRRGASSSQRPRIGLETRGTIAFPGPPGSRDRLVDRPLLLQPSCGDGRAARPRAGARAGARSQSRTMARVPVRIRAESPIEAAASVLKQRSAQRKEGAGHNRRPARRSATGAAIGGAADAMTAADSAPRRTATVATSTGSRSGPRGAALRRSLGIRGRDVAFITC